MIEALQTGIYSKLTGNSPLMAKITAVHDKPPQPTDAGSGAFPYIVIGEMDLDAWATDDTSGTEAVFEVYAYSRYGGNKEAAQILDLVRAALDRQTITVTGQAILSVDFDGSSGISVMADGETRVGDMSFHAYVYPTS